jgi:hypothetical protein
MFDLSPPKHKGGETLTPPQFRLLKQHLPISLFELSSSPNVVHFVGGNNPPMVRCNGDYVGECSLCSLGFPALRRELLLAYDVDEDRLWAALLPEEIKNQLFAKAEQRPNHEWNFMIFWTGLRYFVEHNDGYAAKEFTLDRQERERVIELLKTGQIDLESAVPTLSNGEMLRLPMVTSAAACFGFDVITLDSVDRSEDSSIHW